MERAKLFEELLKNKNIRSHTTFEILQYVLQKGGDKDFVKITVSELEKVTNRSDNWIRRTMAKLEKLGIIEAQYKPNQLGVIEKFVKVKA